MSGELDVKELARLLRRFVKSKGTQYNEWWCSDRWAALYTLSELHAFIKAERKQQKGDG